MLSINKSIYILISIYAFMFVYWNWNYPIEKPNIYILIII